MLTYMTMDSRATLLVLMSVVFIVLRTSHGTIYGGLFNYFSNLTGNYCAGDGLLFSQTGVRLFYCINMCYRAKQQSCVGIFYKGDEQQCVACSRMDSNYLLSMAGTVAWKRSSCSKYLLQEMDDSQLSWSSQVGIKPFNASLGFVETSLVYGAWMAIRSDNDPYFQVDFLDLVGVTGVVIQSRSSGRNSFQWVTEYRVLASRYCSSWEYVVNRDGVIELFPGNTEAETKVTNLFDSPLTARCIRVNPTGYYGYASLRFELLGCDLY